MKAPVIRKTVELPPPLWQRVADFRFGQKLRSEKAAVALLLEAGLDAMQKKPARAGKEKE